jgi:PAS domain S-box-containing protein
VKIAQYLRRHAKPPLWELLVAIVGLTVVLVIWQSLRVHERSYAERLCKLAMDTVQSDLVADLNGRVLSDVSFAPMWQFVQEPTNEQWQATAELYLRRHPEAIAMQWVDSDYVPRWTMSSPNALIALEGIADQQRSFLMQAAKSRDVSISSTKATDALKINFVAAPAFRDDQLRGFTVVTLQSRELLREMLQDVSTLGFAIMIYDGADELYSSQAAHIGAGRDCGASGEIRVSGLKWDIKVAPHVETVSALSSYLPTTWLVLGTIVCVSCSVLLRVSAMAREDCELANRASEHLTESQSRLAGILDISPEAIISIGQQQRITLFNKGAETIFGYKTEEVLGEPLNLLIPQRFRAVHDHHVHNFNEAPYSTMRMNERRAVIGLRHDGTEFPAEASVSKLDLKGERMFIVCVRDITERVKITDALRRAHDELEQRVECRTAELQAANHSLRELSGRVLLMQDEERRRIARELHDSTAQNLLLLGVNLDHLQKAGPGASDTDEVLAHCARLTEQCMSEIRTISYLLHPPMLEEFGLGPALRWYLGGFGKRSGIEATLELDPELGRMPADVELTVFRIVQECLTNVHRHSGSRTARITVRREGAEVSVSIADEGRGISPDILDQHADSSATLGVGIAGMRERLGHLGGRLVITARAPGTTVTGLIPIPDRGVETDAANATSAGT